MTSPLAMALSLAPLQFVNFGASGPLLDDHGVAEARVRRFFLAPAAVAVALGVLLGGGLSLAALPLLAGLRCCSAMPAYPTVRYRLFGADNELIYDHTIRTGYLVPQEASFIGVDRGRLAIEGAARVNINELVVSLWKDLNAAS